MDSILTDLFLGQDDRTLDALSKVRKLPLRRPVQGRSNVERPALVK